MADLDVRDVAAFSRSRGEPAWMTDFRVGSIRRLSDERELRMGEIAIGADIADRFDDSPADVERTDDLASPALREHLDDRGVVFCGLGRALRDHPELVSEHLGTLVTPSGGVAALNAALWSSGTFVYVPSDVEVEVPIEAVRDGSAHAGPFERTLIIVDEGAAVHYVDGCSAPVYSADPLRSVVAEVVVRPGARVTCTTIQNWSPNVRHLAAKVARVEADGHMVWVDGHIGAGATVSRPAVHLVGEGAAGEVLTLAAAGDGQHHDTGADVLHGAPNTRSRILSRSLSRGGVATHHRSVRVDESADGWQSTASSEALVLESDSPSSTHEREAVADATESAEDVTMSAVDPEHLFHLMSLGLSEEQATGLLVAGFVEPVIAALPLEYAVEWMRLIELQIGESVG